MTLARTVARVLLALTAQTAQAVAAPAPHAAGAAGAASAKAAKLPDLATVTAALSGTDVEAAARAATDLGARPEPAAHDALLDALALGLPEPVAVPAIAALAEHPAPPDVGELRRYATHRNLNLRVAAMTALAGYSDPAARQALLAGLRDPIALVRGAAAQACARARLRDSVPPLLELLARGEDPAARALSQLADPDLVAKIADQLGKVPDAALALCLGYILQRADFGPDPARVEVVRAIGKIQDPSAITQLTAYIDATPRNPPRPSRAEAEKMVEARLGGGK